MARKKAIFYPRIEGDVPPYYENATIRLNGGLAQKYNIDPVKMQKVTNHNPLLIPKRNAADAAAAAAESATQDKDQEYAQSKTDLLDVLDDINKHSLLDEVDAEALGMRQNHTPPDPATAKPKISHVTLWTTMIILDWIKGFWFGVIIYGSYDGVNWERLDTDTRSPFEDKRLNKVNNVPENRWYKLVYMDKNNNPFGLESDPVKVVAEIYAP